MAKQILKGNKAREKLLSGISQIADVVITTLGPKGRNIGLEKEWTEPTVINDGVSIAKEIDLPDPFENFGAQLVRQSSSKTADKAGDGTTTSMLLAYEMIKEGIRKLDENANPMTMKKGINLAVEVALKELDSISKPIKNKEEIAQVATISSGDQEIGSVIAEAMNKVGKDGVISSEVHAGLDIQVEFKEGMEFDKGYISSQFVNNPNRPEAEIANPYILITDHVINSGQEVASFLDKLVKGTGQKDIVIISGGVDGSALLTLLANQVRGNINSLAVFAPAFADRRKDILEDIAILTGGEFISKDLYQNIDKVLTIDQENNVLGIEKLGRADSVIADDKTTRIVGGFGNPDKIAERVRSIKEAIGKEKSEFEKEKLQERVAKLVSGAAIIKVGARTEVELSDKKEKVIDAVEATKAAVLEGIVAGGGVALRNCGLAVSLLRNEDEDFQAGIDIVASALFKPMEKIISNAGLNSDEIIRKTESQGNKSWGFNVETEEYGDMFELGVLDPTKVVKEAIQNSASVSAMILTLEAIVCKLPEEKEKS